MISSIKKWFTPPVFEGDEEKTRLAGLFHVMTTAMLLFLITLVVIKLFAGKGLEPVTILDFIGSLFLLPIYHWLKRGKILLAGIWFTSLTFIFLTLIDLSLGTINSFTTASYVLVVFLAGVLFNWRGILTATIVCSLTVLGVMLAGNAGMLPAPDYTVRFSHWFAYTSLFGISGGMAFFALDSTHKTLAHVKREVIERERVEMELRKLTRAVEQSPSSILITDLHGNIEYVNPRFTQLTGYTPDEVIGKNPRILKTDQTSPETHQQLWETIKAGKEWRGEFVNHKKDGSLYYDSAVISPITDQNGIATHYLSVQEDITERKQIEEKLRESEARWQFALEGAGEGVWDWDAIANRVFFSRQWKTMLGYDEHEIGDTLDEWDKRVHPDDKAQCYADLERHFAGETPVYQNEHRVLCKDGTYKWILDRGKVIEWTDDGKPRRVIGVHADISERKRAEEALRDTQRNFRALSEASSEIAYSMSADWSTMLPLDGRELVASSDRALTDWAWLDQNLPRDEHVRVRQAIGDAIARKGLFELEHRVVRPDGSTGWTHSRAVPILDENDDLVKWFGAASDITARKQVEEALQNKENQIRTLSDNLPNGYMYQIDFGLHGETRRFNYVSTGVEKLHGITAQQVLDDPMTLYGQMLEEDRAAATEKEAAAFAAMSIFQIEARHRTVSGQTRWMFLTSTPRKLSNQHIVWDGVALDITERKQVEEALRKSEQKFASFMDHLPGYAYMQDARRGYIYVNQALEEFLGNGKEGWRNKTLEQLLPASDIDRIQTFDESVLTHQTPHTGEETIVKDGQAHTYLSHKFPIYQPDGSLALGGISIDITDRRKAEEALRKSEEQYHDLFAQSPEDIYILATDGRILEFNRAMTIAGNLRDEIIGKNVLSLSGFEDNFEQAKSLLARVIGGNTEPFEYSVKSRAGETIWVEVYPALVSDGDNNLLRLTATNISARKFMESTLQESERFNRATLDALSAHIAILDESGTILAVNRAWREFAESNSSAPHELAHTGINYLTVCETSSGADSEEAPVIAAGIRAMISGERKDFSLEYPCHSPTEKRWFIARVTLFDGGDQLRVVVAHENITERVLAEEQNRQLSRAVESSPSSMLIVDMDGIIQYVNPKFTELTGYAPEEALGVRTQILSLEYTPLETREAMQAAVLAGSEWSGDLCKRKKNGELYWERASMSPIKNEKGEITHYVGMSEDITEYRRIQAEIVLQNEYLSSLQDITLDLLNRQISDVLFTTIVERAVSLIRAQHGFITISEGDDLVMKSATKEFAHRIGCRDVKPGMGVLGRVWQNRTPEVVEDYGQWELRNRSYESENMHAIVGVPIFVNGEIIGVLEVARSGKDESRFTSVDIEILTRFATLASLVIDNSNLYESALREIEERKQAEESLLLAHDQAVKANGLKSQLIAKVSHELRTPLSSVLGFAELLKFNIFGGELNAEQLEATDQIIDSAHYLTDMVNEFLDEAEIESRSLMLDHKPFVVADVLKHVETTMSIIATKKGLDLKTYLAPDLPETIWGDARRLQQILINLTNNAIKFTRAGEVNINMLCHSEDQWAIEVKDTGVGIPRDALEMIFEPFKQMDNAITRENQGTGLGLTITKQLVELMSGRVLVESNVGKGSTFTVVLPIQSAPKS